MRKRIAKLEKIATSGRIENGKWIKNRSKDIGRIFTDEQNIFEAPKLVAAPDEISMEMTPSDVVYSEGKMRLLHFNSSVPKQVRTPVLIAYAVINRYHILDIHPQ